MIPGIKAAAPRTSAPGCGFFGIFRPDGGVLYAEDRAQSGPGQAPAPLPVHHPGVPESAGGALLQENSRARSAGDQVGSGLGPESAPDAGPAAGQIRKFCRADGVVPGPAGGQAPAGPGRSALLKPGNQARLCREEGRNSQQPRDPSEYPRPDTPDRGPGGSRRRRYL